MRAGFAIFIAVFLCASAPARAHSVGDARKGHLDGGWALPLEGPEHCFYAKSAKRGANHATLELAHLLLRSAGEVSRLLPGARLVLGDLSKAWGGNLYGHISHNSGRDADILFYVTDREGRSVEPTRFLKFNRQGLARGSRLRFDTPRNWALVRTLLTSELPAVQHVFVARWIKRLLLAHARAIGEPEALLERAEKVLLQPGNSSPHADHFHVRTFCAPVDLDAGCVDYGTRWEWVSASGIAAPLDTSGSGRTLWVAGDPPSD